ncbi:hypothetical protein EDF88_3984 [Buttiauxella sp. BIGb0552]|nr:DNA polymerase V [Buttiauxella sp. BIGb0552]TDX14666.1 hypothetical protein EDF88_3984 [Buttiauxella sp. BIGb0552]
MPRRDDIGTAFRRAIKIDPRGKRMVTTVDFVRELEKVNWFWSQREANRWIKFYQTCFRDFTDHEGEDKVYFLTSMGAVR